MGARLDFESTLRLIAAETYLAEWDGILGYAGMNNFYLYRPGTSPQAILFPWDADHSFHAADYPLLAGAVEPLSADLLATFLAASLEKRRDRRIGFLPVQALADHLADLLTHTREWAAELAPDGVRVNAVLPAEQAIKVASHVRDSLVAHNIGALAHGVAIVRP